MSMIDTELVEEIREVTRQVWENVLALECSDVPATDGDRVEVYSSVQIVGGWNGAVNLSMPEAIANLVAMSMFEMDFDDLSGEEVADAVGEMANIIGGNVKSLMPGPSDLSLPTVSTGSRLPEFPGTKVREHIQFSVNGQPFNVTIYEQVVAADE